SHLRIELPPVEHSIGDQQWLPMSHTELHLACLYFPVAVRLNDATPSVGLLLGKKHLKRPAVDKFGKWQGGYKPIALRCSAFRCGKVGTDPLNDILIESPSNCLVDKAGIPIIDDGGEPSTPIREIHRLLRLLEQSQSKFSDALDQLLIADLLVPLESAMGA